MPQAASHAEFDAYVREVTRRALWVSIALALGSLVWTQAGQPVALGIALGAACSIARFRRRAYYLIRFANADDGEQKRILVRGRVESFLLAAVAIALAFSLEQVQNLAAFLSLFIVNVIVIVTTAASSRPLIP